MADGVGLDPLFAGVCLKDSDKPVAQYRLHKGDVARSTALSVRWACQTDT